MKRLFAFFKRLFRKTRELGPRIPADIMAWHGRIGGIKVILSFIDKAAQYTEMTDDARRTFVRLAIQKYVHARWGITIPDSIVNYLIEMAIVGTKNDRPPK